MNTLEHLLKKFHFFSNLADQDDPSFFFSLEGIEGSGKSTQIKRIEQELSEKGYQVTLLREPGGTIFGEKLRKAILEQKEKVSSLAEAHLFASARAELLEKKIVPLLKKKRQILILDRYIDSTLLYQGVAGGLGHETVLQIHQHYPLNILPDLTLYLDISVQTSMRRMKERGGIADYFEKQKEILLTQLHQGGDQLCQLFPERIKRVDGEKNEEEVFQQIKNEINILLEKKGH